MENEHLFILIEDDNTNLDYVCDGEKIFSYLHPVGIKHLEASGLNHMASSKLLDGVFYFLSQISLYEKIPTTFYVRVFKYSPWFKKVLEEASYAQFYTNHKPVRVIIDDVSHTPSSYARHSKILQSFKV
jgi:hypothetical protein